MGNPPGTFKRRTAFAVRVSFLLTALFNSCDTIDFYYDAKVSHDMAKPREDDEYDRYS